MCSIPAARSLNLSKYSDKKLTCYHYNKISRLYKKYLSIIYQESKKRSYQIRHKIRNKHKASRPKSLNDASIRYLLHYRKPRVIDQVIHIDVMKGKDAQQ